MENDRSLLLEFLSSGGGKLLALTSKKFEERGQIIKDERFPGKIVFVVERHRSVSGQGYTPGLPMSAYETYEAKYVYDPAKQDIEELHNEEKANGVSINHNGLASEMFDNLRIGVSRLPNQDGFTVTCQGFFDAFNVTTLSEAEAKLTAELEYLNYETCFLSLEGTLGVDIAKLKDAQKIATIEVGLNRLRDAWENPSEEE